MPIIKPYSARRISLATTFCHFGNTGSMTGNVPMQRTATRTDTSTRTDSPRMKCQAFKPARMVLPCGTLPRNSMQAYPTASSSNITQCRPIDSDP